MFRRLGTTLSNEQTQEQEQEQEQRSTAPLNRIMSPAKRRPRWTRQLDEDEILLEFDGAIGEVLPSMQPITAKRRLSYQSKGEAEAETAAELKVEQELELKFELELAVSQVNHQAELQLEQLQLPQGLSITLI